MLMRETLKVPMDILLLGIILKAWEFTCRASQPQKGFRVSRAACSGFDEKACTLYCLVWNEVKSVHQSPQ